MGRDLNVEVGPKDTTRPPRLSLTPDELTAFGFVVRILLWVAFCLAGLVLLGDALDPHGDRSGHAPTACVCAVAALVGLAVSHQKR